MALSKAYATNLNPQLFNKTVEQVPTRSGFGEGLVALGKKNKDVVVLTGDLAGSTKVADFGKAYPERFFEIGVAEQNMMGVAAGLALSGKVPFLSSYATFSPGRNWDQLRVSVCYSNANVKVAGAHAGISVGPDGATHQALEDIAIVRALPNIVVMAPCDSIETKKATLAAVAHKGPVYLRFAREKTPVMTTSRTPFTIGKGEVFRKGSDVTIVACGPLVYEALVAAQTLAKEKIDTEVINMHTVKPLDEKLLVASVKKTRCVVSVEEHQITGGLGGAVAEVLGRTRPTPQEFIGMPDSFGESGQPDELLTKYGMKSNDIVKAAKKAIKRKK